MGFLGIFFEILGFVSVVDRDVCKARFFGFGVRNRRGYVVVIRELV